MKIGLLNETKNPIDNRVALSPIQAKELMERFPDSTIVVQRSDIRVFSDDEYRNAGINVSDDLSDCDVLFGIKEVKSSTLIPSKHYIYFGHIAKKQAYNRPLLLAMMGKGITYTDYEYMVGADGKRLCAFGWWAGVVGVYYTLQGYGLRTGEYALPKPDLKFQMKDLKKQLLSTDLPKKKILVTGNGRVSQGAQFILDAIGATRLSKEEFCSNAPISQLSYTVACHEDLVSRTDNEPYSHDHFINHPELYKSNFMTWGRYADMLVTGHFWAPNQPVYLDEENLRDPDLRIKMIGDVTCDIKGSIKSTIRSSTHDDPFYDYNPNTGSEEKAFSGENNITVMAVDTCPNALAHDSSKYFGDMLIQHVFIPLLKGEADQSQVIRGATILDKGQLTERFSYLEAFAKGEE
ncbi:MAG: hypothetical protein J5637_05425 [Prevotella sp.]|nr:hypothetical protein [Prevotella sp.]